MKSKGILPDTCAWIDYFRPGTAPLGQSLAKALTTETVFVCGPVIYELVQGVRSEKEQALLRSVLNALPFLEMNEALWIKAGRLSANLRKEGKTIPFSDIIIAVLAMEKNLAVMTVDEHFRDIPGLETRMDD
ncbi:MAG: PIN domain-containing protein [Syntrophales bacterium]|nr:PIN domain-containing protein [Syntrophales bacterium]